MFEGGDIKMRGGKIIEKNLRWGATLKGRKGFCIAKAALTGIDHRVRAALLGHEGDKLVMVGHAAVGAKQTLSLPLSATPAAAEIAAPLDASHFGKRRPGTADRTIPFHPTYGFR